MKENNGKKKKRKKWPIVLLVIVLVLVLVFFGLFRAGTKRLEEASRKLTTEAVKRGTISLTTEGSGSVEAAATRALTLEYDGKLETIYVETGDQVKVGDELAVYDKEALDTVIEAKEAELSELETSIATTDDSGSETITAPVSGRVKRIYASVDDVVTKVVDRHGGLAEISADGRLKVEFSYSGTALKVGDSVTVEFDSYSETGIVESVEGETVLVTIPDDTEYQVDKEAVIWGNSGERLGSGLLKSNRPYLVRASYGIIDEVHVDRQTKVSAGDTMFDRRDVTYNQTYLDLLEDRQELVEELRELKEYQKNPVVVSEYDGYIVTLDAMEGMTYEKDQQFCTIADAQTLYLKVEIDELDIDGVEVGQTASVVFDAFEDQTYEGVVEKISGKGNNSGGVTTYTVTIAMDGDTRLKDAMSATATIVMDSKDNVLLIPVDAVEVLDGEQFVEVEENGVAQQRRVTLGLINDEYAEVTEGLSEGEQVIVVDRSSADLFTQIMTRQQEFLEERQGGNDNS